ncbi:poly(U)-specific endoribonuclease-like [Parus major]|uniref:poly(U)-specific endoribonuclease-like n=1 Tax=Parus major TaxID=9157 RepID=UPI0014442FA6|nr:poly(U)-specific endoribonuclease-like [Parus major]
MEAQSEDESPEWGWGPSCRQQGSPWLCSRWSRAALGLPQSSATDSDLAPRGSRAPLSSGQGVPKDLYTPPESCEGRCGEPFSEEDECHCHPECGTQHNCCEDYERHCGPGGEGAEGGARSRDRYSSEAEFVQDLKEMWFGLYSRGDGERDSSGFEHVFSGEVKKGKVSGFHNWIRFYLLEKQGGVNYFSHNFNGPWDTYPDVLGLQFSWDGFYKEVGSAFIGCSPEFEFGLYSLCFLARPGRA